VDLKVPIVISDDLFTKVITASGLLDLASGEIFNVEYQKYDVAANGLPWKHKDYEFSSGMLSNAGREIEFSVNVDKSTGEYTVSPDELLEIKSRAAALFSGAPRARS
jgi:hypothetical protein